MTAATAPRRRSIAGYGWTPDLPDHRDLRRQPPGVSIPQTADLRPFMPPVYDQGKLGSCTANAIGAAVAHRDLLEVGKGVTPSRLFIYYGEREIEGTVEVDSGAQIRDGIKVVAKLGAPPETTWPYDVRRFRTKPSKAAYEAGVKNVALAYERVGQTGVGICAELAAGNPVVIGFTVYESFEGDEVARTGTLGLPAPGEKPLGGHAVLIVGYDLHDDVFLVRNSWSSSWGNGGHFTVPMAYFLDPQLASDLWVITKTS